MLWFIFVVALSTIADIVESELFSSGFLTAKKPNTGGQHDKHDSLLEKIAQSKEERIKRLEANEANRQKLKDADSEWTDKVRFMLDKIGEIKPKASFHLTSFNETSLILILCYSCT